MEKRNLLYAFLLVLMTVAVSCKKDAEVNKDTFKIEHEEVVAMTQSVKITGSYDYAGTIDCITLELGRKADLVDSDAYRTLLDGTDFSVEVKNLRTNVTYYYRYSVEYGGKSPYLTEIKSFKTEEYNLPEVKSKEVVAVGVNRAEVSGEVLGDGGGDAVTLRGICWNTSHNPSVGDEYANVGEGIGAFTCELTNLQPEKTYYARAFAGNSKGVAYGEELTFVTLAAGSLAEVHTVGITGNVMLQATVSGEVTNEGTSAVLERGVCYSKEHYPTTSGLHVSSGSGMGEYSCRLMNLDANATYYVRAYAINSLGIAYGEEMNFVALTEMTAPLVITNKVENITESSATANGSVISDGGSSVIERGLCWSLEHDPTIDDTHANCGSGIGSYSSLMPHLLWMTTYYVRAYAINEAGIAYGEEVSFTVGVNGSVATVITNQVVDITTTTALGGGNVVDDGGEEVTERGVCWSTRHRPTISDSHDHSGAGLGSFTCVMAGLMPGTTYYVRAYAINHGISYGDEVSFTTEGIVPGVPEVMTYEITEISETSAVGGGEVISDGGFEVTERGICWSTHENPTVADSHVNNGTGMGSFTVEMTGLSEGTKYYVRAYARNAEGVGYGNGVEFMTHTLAPNTPTVRTLEITDIIMNAAVGNGEVIDEGDSEVIARGICWSTNPEPTIADSHGNNGVGIGYYTVNMSGLTPGTTYYVRAYAMNSYGIAYGEEIVFTTYNPDITGTWICTHYNSSGNPTRTYLITLKEDGTVDCDEFSYMSSSYSISGSGQVGISLRWSSGYTDSADQWGGSVDNLDYPLQISGTYYSWIYNGSTGGYSESDHVPFIMVRNSSK
jgi:hypothetical protein